MSQQPVRSALVLALLLLFGAATWMFAGQKKPDPAPGEETARDALVKFDKEWKDYTNEANFGDTRWKLRMQTRVHLAKAGAAAVPVLEEAAKDGSAWKSHTRRLASEMLAKLRGPKSALDALASYDLGQMDSAKEGKLAPDFALSDASGQSYRLSQFRGTKTVVLTFILQDI
jgi:hypothetical protein